MSLLGFHNVFTYFFVNRAGKMIITIMFNTQNYLLILVKETER